MQLATRLGPLLKEIAQRDSAIADHLGRPLDVRVVFPQPFAVHVLDAAKETIGARDVVGWVVTLVGIAVATAVTVGGWQRAARISRESQELRRQIEDGRRKAQLVLRIRATLEAMGATARSTLKKDATHAINPETMNGILVEWARYDRVSDDLTLLSDPGFQDRLDPVLGFGRMVAEKIMEDERRIRETRDKLGRVTPEGLELDIRVIARAQKKREELHGLLTRVDGLTKPLLEEFNRKWPADPQHSPQEVPEVEQGDPMPVFGVKQT